MLLANKRVNKKIKIVILERILFIVKSMTINQNAVERAQYYLQIAIHNNEPPERYQLPQVKQLNTPLANGYLPLHFAIVENQTAWVKALINSDVSVLKKDSYMLSAIDYAVLFQKYAMLTHILPNQKNLNPDLIATEMKQSQVNSSISEMCSLIDNIKIKTEKLNPFLQKIYQQDFEGIKDNYNKNTIDTNHLKSALHILVMNQKFSSDTDKIFDLLMKQGVDLNATDEDGRTALHYSALHSNKGLFIALLKNGANLLVKDKNGVSPLSILCCEINNRDPLKLTKSQTLILVSLALQWSIRIGINNDLFSTTMANALYSITNLLVPATQLQQLFNTSTVTKSNVIIFLGCYFLALHFKHAKLTLNIWLVAKTAFFALKSLRTFTAFSQYKPGKSWIYLTTSTIHALNAFSNFSRKFPHSYFAPYLNTEHMDKSPSLASVNFTKIRNETLQSIESATESILNAGNYLFYSILQTN